MRWLLVVLQQTREGREFSLLRIDSDVVLRKGFADWQTPSVKLNFLHRKWTVMFETWMEIKTRKVGSRRVYTKRAKQQLLLGNKDSSKFHIICVWRYNHLCN